MVSALDVPAEMLILKISEKLKTEKLIEPPQWTRFVKTGTFAQRKPHNPDWFYDRCASILRRIYIEKNVGVGRLRTRYGGRKNPGTRPEHHADASGNIIRKALQQLEKAGFIKKEKVGRVLTPAGLSLLEKTAVSIYKALPREERKVVKMEVKEVEKIGGRGGKPRSAGKRAPKKAGGEAAGAPEKTTPEQAS